MKNRRFGTPAEWEVLSYITAHHPITARAVADHFAVTHDWARTTVLTLMDRLREKGYLTRDESGAVHQYSPSQPRQELMGNLVHDFVQRPLGGSLEETFAALVAREDVTADDLDRLAAMIEQAKRERAERECSREEEEP